MVIAEEKKKTPRSSSGGNELTTPRSGMVSPGKVKAHDHLDRRETLIIVR